MKIVVNLESLEELITKEILFVNKFPDAVKIVNDETNA